MAKRPPKRPFKHRRHPAPRRAAPAPVASARLLEGRLSLHRDGYGFVIPSAPVAPGDIFIPPSGIAGAMHGDVVAVRIEREGPDGRAQGRIARIVRRANLTVVGVFRAGSPCLVQPMDERLREPIVIARGQEIPAAGLTPGGADRVLGPEATHGVPIPKAHAEALAALDGQIVDVELSAFPTPTAPARGRVLEVLGHRDDFGVDVEIMIRKHHLPHRFPADVLAEAEALPAALPAVELERRRDFRALPIVTIDGETARDFDDAVRVERRPEGGFELQVHIADVSWYVMPDSALDREARLRGTSVYFPDRAVPMLPPRLSTDLCSLRPDEDRLVLSCVMQLDADAELRDYWIGPGVIRSAARMTYTEVNRIIAGDREVRAARPAALVAGFEDMAALQGLLQARRRRRGSIDFDLPEPEIAFDEFGLMRSIMRSERNIAHRLIEEFMLACAETVARHARAAGVASVYRIHEPPELKKVIEFEQVAATFGYSLGLGPLPVKVIRERVRGQVRTFEVPKEAAFHIRPHSFQKLVDKIADRPEERILSYLMLRSLRQARYSTEPKGHFALATDTYTHFTSPIRRYPDLMLHRIIKDLLAQGVPGTPLPGVVGRGRAWSEPPPAPALEAQCRDSSEAERRADDAERELMDWKKVRFMESHVGEEFAALITHVNKNGLYIELTDLFIDGHISPSSLGDDRYRFRELTHEWIGERSRRRFRLGDRIQVIVERIDPVRQKILFAAA